MAYTIDTRAATKDCSAPNSIQSELQLLEKALAEVHERISGHESRISSVCRPLLPVPADGCGPRNGDVSSELLALIQRLRETAFGAAIRLSELTQRVEI